jgi:hypothetical protein
VEKLTNSQEVDGYLSPSIRGFQPGAECITFYHSFLDICLMQENKFRVSLDLFSEILTSVEMKEKAGSAFLRSLLYFIIQVTIASQGLFLLLQLYSLCSPG